MSATARTRPLRVWEPSPTTLTGWSSFMSSVPGQSSSSSGLFGALRTWLRRDCSGLSSPLDRLWCFNATYSPAHKALHVLAVDDDPANLLNLSAILAPRGITATLTRDGVEAVELACARSFDIVFMDVQMPVLDGLTATAHIRHFESMQSRPHVPVVAYGGTNIGDSLLRASGMNDTLGKPCSVDELEACMARWCPTFVPRAATAHDVGAASAANPRVDKRADCTSTMSSAV
jgi:CheY-like chemotaxis protein